MLRKVKQQVTQALNAVSPGEPRHGILEEEENSFEGLLCPQCLRAFLTTNELQEHFYTHELQQNEGNNVTSPEFPATSTACYDDEKKSPDNAEVEITELKNLLDDESRYSFELKKELDILHEIAAHQTNVPKEEVPYLLQQIQVLEAGRSMITQKLLSLEKDISLSNRRNETLKREKLEMEDKITQLSGEVAKFATDLEQQGLENIRLSGEKIQLQKVNEVNAQTIDQLQRQLEQRPSEDDIKVLKKELIRSQQLMDSITQEREDEIAGHVQMIEKLKKQKELLEEDVLEKNKKLEATVVKLEEIVQEKKRKLEHLLCRNTDIENRIIKLEEAVDKRNKAKSLEYEGSPCPKCDNVTVRELDLNCLCLLNSEKEYLEGLERLILQMEEKDKIIGPLKKESERVLNLKNKLETDLEERVSNFEEEFDKLFSAASIMIVDKQERTSRNQRYDVTERGLCNATTSSVHSFKEDENVIVSDQNLKSSGEVEEKITSKDVLKGDAQNENFEFVTNVKNTRIFENMLKFRKCFEDQKRGLDDFLGSLKADVEKVRKEFEFDKEVLQNKLLLFAKGYGISQQKVTELSTVNVKLEKLLEQKCEELQEFISGSKRLEDLGKQKSEELITVKNSYEIKIKQFEQRLNELQIRNDEILALNASLNGEVTALSKAIGEANKLTRQKEELFLIEADEKRKLLEEKDGFFKDIETLNVKLRLLEKNALDNSEKLKTAEEKLDEAIASNAFLKQELADKDTSIKDLEKKLNEKVIQLDTKSAEYKERLTVMQEKEGDLSLKLRDSLEALKRKDEEFFILEKRAQSVSQNFEECQCKLNGIIEEKASLEKNLEGKCHEIEKLERKLNELNGECSKNTEDFKRMERKWDEEKSLLDNEVEELKNGLTSASEMNLKLAKELDAAKENCGLLKKNLDKKEKSWRDSEERLCSEKKHLEDELQSKTNQVEELFTALKKNESLAEENSINITKLKNELQVAEEARNELTKVVNAYNDEKKTLLERCLNTESDLDFERERAVQNRRQFEEVLSAMHELGRANQTLQMDISKQFGRKWLDDTEAVSCNGCKKAFSLMFRKHHCRMCGQIFCASCSSHTAEVASNKNPVRVCNLCYQEILSR